MSKWLVPDWPLPHRKSAGRHGTSEFELWVRMARRIDTAKAAGKVSIAVFASRILGLVREMVMAALFGASAYMDAWLVAFRIPNMLRDLFAEGALSSAFIPTFTKTLKQEGEKEAWLLASLVINGLLIILGGLAIVFVVFSDFFVHLLAGGFVEAPEKFLITTTMVQILSPFLALVALASVVMGVLNTLNHYFLPALAPAFFNVALILAGLFLVPAFENWGFIGIYAIAVGAVVGGVFQLAVQLPLLFRRGFRYRLSFDFRNPGVRRVGRLIAPAVIGVSAVQINIVVNTYLASLFGDGPVSWLSYAFRLIYLPIGLFGVAVGVVNLREVSVYAAQEQWRELKETVANSVKLISFLAMPSMVGLIVLSVPIIRVLYERGEFVPADTQRTALALTCYSLGLLAYSCIKVYVPTFYALNDTRTPVTISFLAVVLNITVNVMLVFFVLPDGYEYAGLAFGTSVSVLVNNGLLAWSFRRRMGSLQEFKVNAALKKTFAAAVVMGLVVFALRSLLDSYLGEVNQLLLAVNTALLVGSGILVYLVCCHIFSVEETRLLLARLRRK